MIDLSKLRKHFKDNNSILLNNISDKELFNMYKEYKEQPIGKLIYTIKLLEKLSGK